MSMPANFSIDDKIIERKSEYNKNSHATSLTITSKFEKPNLAMKTDSKIGEEENEEIISATQDENQETILNVKDGSSSNIRVKMSINHAEAHFSTHGSIQS